MNEHDATFNGSETDASADTRQLQAQLTELQTTLTERNGELQQATEKIASLELQQSQLEVLQRQTERLLSAQAEQIRQRVRAELEGLDTSLNEKDKILVAAENKINELKIQLAEKQLLLESRDIEVENLKVTIQNLLERMSRGEPAEKNVMTSPGHEIHGLVDGRSGDFTLGEPNLTEAQKARLTRLQEISVTLDSVNDERHRESPSPRFRSSGRSKRRWKLWV